MNEEQNKYQLPKEWKWEVSSNILDIRDGTHDTPKYVKENGIPLITSKNLKKNKIDFEKVSYISKEDHAEISKRSKVEAGDILFAMIGTIGNPAIIKGDANFSIKNVGLFKKNENKILPSFLVNFLRSHTFEKQMNERKLLKGTTQKFIPLGNLRNINIPLPPKHTQQSIVSKIEELFSELDKGVENLRLAQLQLKTYRQSVLKWAFEGKLTNENVKEGELPKGWKITNMGDVIEKPKYGTSKKCEYETKGIGVLRIPNIVKGVVDSDDLKFAKFDEQEIKTYSLREGDILTIRSNGSVDIVGKCALITRKDEGFLYAGYLIRLRPLRKLILPKYLINILSSINLRNQIERKAKSTSGVNNINSEELSGLLISLPQIDEQYAIVQEIESSLSVADKMEESITLSIQQAEALRQSILKKAFEGKLIN